MTTISDKAHRVLRKAQELAENATSWNDFSNRVFAEPNGLVPNVFPRMTERREFYSLPEYEHLNALLKGLIDKFGIDDGRAQKKSGKFLVRLPRSIHQALDVEAIQQGVSLNQLALAKLAMPLAGADPTIATLIEAYTKVYDGYSSDRVIVHPVLNERFLAECRKLGIDLSDYEINHKLYDIRKSGKSMLPPATKKPTITDYDEFLFASEIAFRYLQQKDGVTLDRVLCDTTFRANFDEIAKRLAPAHDEFKLRMGALYLRKTHNLRPNEIATSPKYDLLRAGTIAQIKMDSLPEFPGMYAFYEKTRPIFAGETAGLQHRIGLHMKNSGQMFLPSWLELGIEEALELRYVAVPKASSKERISWLNQFINRERPPLNYLAA